MLRQIQDRYTHSILTEALRRFDFIPDPIQELEGSAFVYEGLLNGQLRILKIVPGVWNTHEQITGSTCEQFLAEVHLRIEQEIPVVVSEQGDLCL